MTLSEFQSLPQKQKLDCLYENQVTTLKLISGYKLYYKVTSVIGAFLTGAIGLLYKIQLGA